MNAHLDANYFWCPNTTNISIHGTAEDLDSKTLSLSLIVFEDQDSSPPNDNSNDPEDSQTTANTNGTETAENSANSTDSIDSLLNSTDSTNFVSAL